MRRIYLFWSILVLGIVGTVYGTHLLIYHFSHGNGFKPLALVLLIAGIVSIIFFLIAYISDYLSNKKRKANSELVVEEPQEEKEVEQPIENKEEKAAPIEIKETKIEEKEESYREPSRNNSYNVYSSPSYSTVYVKKVGYGPILRISGPNILDMRSNTYYRIEGNIVNQDGYGPRYEIRGTQIRDIYGSYLYELSGSNINKVFGGFYASISGNYITLYDLSEKYEMTDSLSKKQILTISALVFGKY